METFVVYALNVSTREFDMTKITTFGPMALALKIILSVAERNRPKELETVGEGFDYTSVYRGLKLTQK